MIRLLLSLAAILAGPASFAAAAEPNTLAPGEKKLGFRLLFNGKTLDGWQHKGNWKVANGEITRGGRGGSLVYRKSKIPNDFELRFEWKVAPGSNSGIYYRPGQYEYQILDNKKHRDGRNPRTSAASLYFCMAPSHDATQKPGTWNTGRIVCQGTVIQHWLNGKKVIDFDYADARWKDNVKLLRLRGGNLKARGANLSLQDHGDPVWYRSIRLRTIPSNEKLVSENIAPEKLKPAVLKAEREKLRKILERRKKAKQKKRKKT